MPPPHAARVVAASNLLCLSLAQAYLMLLRHAYCHCTIVLLQSVRCRLLRWKPAACSGRPASHGPLLLWSWCSSRWWHASAHSCQRQVRLGGFWLRGGGRWCMESGPCLFSLLAGCLEPTASDLTAGLLYNCSLLLEGSLINSMVSWCTPEMMCCSLVPASACLL
jgi:hypothetical protein